MDVRVDSYPVFQFMSQLLKFAISPLVLFYLKPLNNRSFQFATPSPDEFRENLVGYQIGSFGQAQAGAGLLQKTIGHQLIDLRTEV